MNRLLTTSQEGYSRSGARLRSANIPLRAEWSHYDEPLLGVLIPRDAKSRFALNRLLTTSQEGYSRSGARLRSANIPLRAEWSHYDEPLLGVLIPRDAKSRFALNRLLTTSQEGYSRSGARLRSTNIPLRAEWSHYDEPLLGVLIPWDAKSRFALNRLLTTSQEGFEPPTDGLEGRCSIQLSYWDTYYVKWDALIIITHPKLFSKRIYLTIINICWIESSRRSPRLNNLGLIRCVAYNPTIKFFNGHRRR